MFNEVIKKLLRQIEILPEKIVIIYLMKKFPNLSENQVRQAIHAACRNRTCYRIDDNIARTKFSKTNSQYIQKAQALRVMLEINPDADFVCDAYPWLLVFTKGEFIIQICYISHNTELATSMVIANKPVPVSDRPFIKRIGIVDFGCDVTRIKAAGFNYFCTVDTDTFKPSIIHKCDPETAWEDVPDKA